MNKKRKEIEPRWLSTIQLADFLSVSKSILDKFRASGGGPPFSQIGKNQAVRYDRESAHQWMKSFERGGEEEEE